MGQLPHWVTRLAHTRHIQVSRVPSFMLSVSVSRVLRRPPRTFRVRSYTSKPASPTPKAVPGQATSGGEYEYNHTHLSCHLQKPRIPTKLTVLTVTGQPPPPPPPRSSCPPNAALVGLNYLKDQPPVLALPDEAYPPWLWSLLDKSELPNDGPGGKAEKRRLRRENRQRIRDQNFMKTQ